MAGRPIGPMAAANHPRDIGGAIVADHEDVELLIVLMRGSQAGSLRRQTWRRDPRWPWIPRRAIGPVATADDRGHMHRAVVPDHEGIELIVSLLCRRHAGARRR